LRTVNADEDSDDSSSSDDAPNDAGPVAIEQDGGQSTESITSGENRKRAVVDTFLKYCQQRLRSDRILHQVGLLASEWILYMYSRWEKDRLCYIRRHQLRLIREDELLSARKQAGVKMAGKIFLPNTFVGSRTYWSTAALNGQHLAVERGMPTYLLTITCNPRL